MQDKTYGNKYKHVATKKKADYDSGSTLFQSSLYSVLNRFIEPVLLVVPYLD